MKSKILLPFIGFLLLCGCHGDVDDYRITYFKDVTTNQCFAYPSMQAMGHGFTTVECTPEVEKAIQDRGFETNGK